MGAVNEDGSLNLTKGNVMTKSKAKTPVAQFDPADMEREELTHEVKTKHSDYTPDTLGDPEGSQTRAENVATAEFPDWVYTDYEPSTTTLWGGSWPDGKAHLVPLKSTVDSVIQLHVEGMDNYAGMVDLAMKSEGSTIDLLRDTYDTILTQTPDKYHFGVLRGIGNQVQTLLAERAYRKYLYISAAGRVRDTSKEMPEYVEKLQDSMFTASIDAGVWYTVHQDCWKSVGWKGQPTYYVENEIKYRLINAAKYIDTTHRAVQPVRATMADYSQVALTC